jgi:small GTP-binding protein
MSKKGQQQQIKNETPIPCKVILVGESGVGKTSIISRFIDKYEEKTESTLSSCFTNKTIIVDGYKINLEIWDTAGQEIYRAVTSLFYKDANICLLVYDITNKTTFNCIRDYWYENVVSNGMSGILFGVAGNKCDLYEEEDVSENEAIEFSSSINACFKLTSAKLNTSINDMFSLLGQQFIKSDFMKALMPKYIDKNVNERELSIERIKIDNNNENNENQNQKTKTKKTKKFFC